MQNAKDKHRRIVVIICLQFKDENEQLCMKLYAWTYKTEAPISHKRNPTTYGAPLYDSIE